MSRAPSYCFFAERQVGIGSAAGAIEPHLRKLPGVTWTDITYVQAGGAIERLPLPGRIKGTLRGVAQTRRVLRNGSFDALFFLTHNPAVFQQSVIARTPTLLWTDVTPKLLDAQADQYNHPASRFAATARLKSAMVKRTFRLAKLCVSWSEWARRSFMQDYAIPDWQTAIVAPGVDLTKFTFGAVNKPGLPRLLFVGGDFVRKGGDLLLDVFRQHLRGRCVLDLVTRGDVAEEEGVRVHRNLSAGTPELLALYDAASVFVLPTRGDCFSIASIEAMAKGLPVLVTRVGGIPEIVEHGQSGFLLEKGSGAELLGGIERLLGDPKLVRAMAQRGREIVDARFDARITAQSLLRLMDRISGQAGSS